MSKRPQNWWAQWLIIADEATTRVKRVMLTPGARSQNSPVLQISDLEPRILFSATPIDPGSLPGGDPAAMVVEVETPATESDSATDHAATAQTSEQSAGEIIFIDSAVPEIEQLLDDLRRSGRNAEVFLLAADRDGVDQITEILDSRIDIDSIHIISHAQRGAVKLGNVWLGESNLAGYAGQFALWQSAMTTDGDILFYGCDLAGSESGRSLLESLGSLCDCDVAASVNDTGHADYGGDWDLEYQSGTIDAELAFSVELRQDWSHLMALSTVSDNFDDGAGGSSSYSGNDGSQNWDGDWIETNDTANKIQVVDKDGGGDWRLRVQGDSGAQDYWVSRLADLSGSTTATFTYDYELVNHWDAGFEIDIRDNDTGWTNVVSYSAIGSRSGPESIAVAANLRDNGLTEVRFRSVYYTDPDSWYIDNVQIEHDGTAGGQRYYLDGVGDQSDVPTALLKTAAPTDPTLDNFDPGRDLDLGLLIAKGGADINESDSTTQQAWIVSAAGVVLDGPASLTVWSAMKSFNVVNAGSITAYLVDSDASASSLTEIASATITRADWDVADSGTWIEDTFNFGNVSHALGAGRYLGVKLIVNGASGDDMWIAYDATAYPAKLDYTESSNTPPTLTTLTNPVDSTNEDIEVEVSFADLTTAANENDVDGTVDAFVVKTISTGTLKIGATAGTATAWAAGSNDTVDAGNNAYWTPDTNANGTQNAFEVVAQDDGGLESTLNVTAQVGVASVNDDPTATATPGFLNYTENDPATPVDSGIMVTDPDGGDLVTAQVRIASGYASGEDLLEFTDQLGITGSWDGGSGTLSLSGISSIANYQTAMRSVTYSNSSEDPDESLRIINFQVFDGIVSSTSLKMMNVAAVNDQPVLNGIAGDSQSYAAGIGATIVEQGSDVTVGDLDSTDFDTGNLAVSIAAGGDNAEDVLSIRDQGTGAGQIGFDGVNVSYGGTLIGTASGGTTGAPLVVAFNGASTNTAAAALIGNITYENLAAVTPTTGARTVRFVLDDGDGDSSLANDATVTVSAAQNTLVVDTTSDVADGTTTSIAALLGNKGADGKISLREAIAATNNTTNGSTPDEIHFEITDPLVGGAHAIVVTSALPGITDAVIIDGTTDTDFTTTPIIVLDGNGAGSLVDGLTLAVGSDGSTIRSLVVQRFAGDGIEINGSNNNKIEGNYIGTNAAGTVDQGNSREGIHITNSATNNTIGGTTSASRNVISGNDRDGLFISVGANGNQIQGNFIGTNAAGTSALGNTLDGLWIEGSNNAIGGVAPGAGNVISGNLDDGLSIDNGGSGNAVQGNLIGTDMSGTLSLGNTGDGVLIISGTGNVIGGTATNAGNTIAHSGVTGVSIDAGNQNAIRGNSIFANAALGIDLLRNGVTINDAGDGDAGANTLQNVPVLTAATVNGSDLTITGTLDSTPNTAFDFDFFASTTADPSGSGEAERYLGSALGISTDGSGNLMLNELLSGTSVSAGNIITATASDQNGNTSEFAFNVVATLAANNSPSVANPIPDQDATEDTPFSFQFAANTFDDLDADALTYTATLDDLSPLPAWLTFTAATRTFLGTPLNADVGAITVRVEATDPSLTSATDDFDITVANTNDAPTDITLDNTNVNENADGAVVGNLGVIDPDAGETHSWSVDDTRFEIVGTQLKLKSGQSLDKEFEPTVNLTITATDQGGIGIAYNEAFVITVNDVNETPTDITLDNTNVNENADGAVVGNLGVIDPDAGDTHSWSVDDVRFEIVGTQLKLKSGQSLDKEFEPTVNLTITATDQGGVGIAYNEAFVITVNDVNETPTDITLDNTNVNENADGAVVGNLGVIDPDAGETHSWSVDDTRFEIVGTQLKLKSGQSLDKEFEPTVNLTITATDQGGIGIAYNEAFVITVNDVNETPTDITLDNTNVNENADGAVVGNLGVIDPDAGDTHSWSVDDVRFEIVGTQLKLKSGQSLDKEFEPTVNLTITATDQGGIGIAYNEAFVITVNDVNETPTDITLDNTNVNENADGAVVGNLGVIDPDAGDTHSWSVDDVRFEIVGTQLKLKAGQSLDQETEPTVNLTITATDQGGIGIAYNEAFVITVDDVNETPTDITLDNTNVNENADGAVVGNLGVIDPDAGDTHSWSVDDVRFEIVGTQLKLKSGQSLDKEFEPTVNLTITATDQGGVGIAYNEAFVITVDDVNEAPTDITLDNSNVNENADAAVIGNLGIIDPDLGDTHTWNVDDARFEIVATQLKLRSGQTLNRETEPTVHLTITATDQGGSAYNEAFAITVDDVNEAPIDIMLGNLDVNENDDGAIIGNVLVTDPDTADTHTWSVNDARFQVVAGQLKLKSGESLDHEAAPTVNLAIEVTDQGRAGFSYTESFTITVNDVNDAPTADGEAFTTQTGKTLNIAAAGVLAGDTDPDGDLLTAVLVTGPANGSLTLFADGSFVYVPNATFTGVDSYLYQSSDGALVSSTTLVTITVQPLSGVPLPAPIPTDTGDDPDDPDPPLPPPPDPTPEIDPPPVEEAKGDRPDTHSPAIEPATLAVTVIQVIPMEEPIGTDLAASLINAESEPEGDAEEKPQRESAKPSSDNAYHGLRSQTENLYQIATSDPQWKSLDSFRNDVLGDWSFQTLVVGAAISTSLSLSVGYVFWTVRAGWLASALMTSMPVWRSIDPLPVLEYLEDDMDQADDESLQSIIEQQGNKRTEMPDN